MGLLPDDIGSFDVGRLTLAGWLAGALSGAAGLAPAFAIHSGTQANGPPDGVLIQWVGLPISVAVFCVLRVIARSVGIKLVRPPKA